MIDFYIEIDVDEDYEPVKEKQQLLKTKIKRDDYTRIEISKSLLYAYNPSIRKSQNKSCKNSVSTDIKSDTSTENIDEGYKV